jgi:non-canonical (house-cleaning) NTP pyrophosphatase
MKAYISSKSPVKHAAVKASFDRFHHEIETIAAPMQSDVNEQPLSIDETYEGALNRHAKLVKEVGDKANGCYLITIESGIATLRPEHNAFGVEVVVVEKDGERHIGIEVDIEFPRSMTDRVPSEYADVGVLVQAEYGAKTKDPYPYFTNGQLTRQGFIETALNKVLVRYDELVENNG